MKIAVASGKGGTGKTTVATNLATLIAEDEPVLLADLDVEEPNAGLFVAGEKLHAEPVHRSVPEWVARTCRRCGRCSEVCRFNAVMVVGDEVMVFPELCHSCHACSGLCPTDSLPMGPRPVGELQHRRLGNLDLIEARLIVGEEQATPVIQRALAYVERHRGDRPVILDAPPGTACSMVAAIRDADLVLMVTEPTPFGLHDLKLAVATAQRLDRPCAVVINRHGAGDAPIEAFCRREGVPVVAHIPHSRDIAARYAAGHLLVRDVASVRRALEDVRDFLRDRERQVPA